MADQKLTALTALATLSADDLFYVVDDPAGAALSRKMAASVLDARFATAAQGALAATAVQPGDLAAVAFSGDYGDLVNTPGPGAPVGATYIVQTPDGTLTNEQALSALATGLVKNTTTTGVLSIAAQGTDYYAPGGTDVAIADGGTGQSTAQAAINALTAVAGATNEHVLTKDTATGNAVFKAAAGGSSLPVADTQTIVMGSADNTKLFRIEVDGFTAGATRVMTPPNQNFLAAGLDVAQTFTAAQIIDVATDVVPLTVEKSASQTANIFQTRQAGAANTLTHIKNNGQMEVIFDANVSPGLMVSRLGSTVFFYVGGSNEGHLFTGTDVATSDGGLLSLIGNINRGGAAFSSTSILRIAASMNPTAGSSEHYGINLVPVINQTGSANGDVTIFRAAPVLSSVVGTLRFFEFIDGANRVFEIGQRGNTKINQANTTAALPNLWLNQADLSEEFIRFQSTVGAGNPINTTALGAYYGRVRVYVEGVGEKWLALYDT